MQRPPEEAEQILAGWSALFHPALISHYEQIGAWDRVYHPTSEKNLPLVIIPPCVELDLNRSWLSEVEANGTLLLRDYQDRESLVGEILEKTGLADHPFDDDLVADFLALGTGYLLVELLTRQLRYMSTLDETQFETYLKDAVRHARQGNRKESDEAVGRGFDLITEAREYFYPVESYFLELLLLAPPTLGEKLRRDLDQGEQLSLLLSPECLLEIKNRHPETLASLKKAVAEKRAEIVGCERHLWPQTTLSVDTLDQLLLEGRSVYEETLDGYLPRTYGRPEKGLSPVLPGLLKSVGYENAFHFTPDGWHRGSGSQSKIQWKGTDGTSIDALVRFPIDATDPSAYLELPETLGNAMDMDHAATVVFARYPGTKSCWLDDLRRMDRHSPALGKFHGLEEFFSSTRYSGMTKSFGYDSYRLNPLNPLVEKGEVPPVETWRRYQMAQCRLLLSHASRTLLQLVSGKFSPDSGVEESAVGREIEEAEGAWQGWIHHCETLLFEASPAERSNDREDRCPAAEKEVTETTRLFHQTITGMNAAPAEVKDELGFFVMNPWSFESHVYLDADALPRLPRVEGNVRLAREEDGRKEVLLKVPPLGYAWVGPAPPDSPSESKPKPSVAEKVVSLFRKKSDQPPPKLIERDEEGDYRIRNDFFEVNIDPATGAVRSLLTYRHRGSRLAQQIAFRLPEYERRADPRSEEDPNFGYSIMTADRFEIEQNGPLTGILRIEGRLLLPEGEPAARFVDRLIVRRGSRRVEHRLTLSPDVEPGEKPWDSYFCLRTAWSDATVDFHASLNSGTYPVDGHLLFAPLFVDMRTETEATTLLAAGLPFHRRFGLRRLDTILIPRGETTETFRLATAIDLPRPMTSALEFLAPLQPLGEPVPPPPVPAAWLFHLNSRNLQILDWKLLDEIPPRVSPDPQEEPSDVEETPEESQRGSASVEEVAESGGVMIKLIETEGKRATTGLQCFLPISRAWSTPREGKPPKELEVEGDRVVFEIAPHQRMFLTVLFASSK
jgi:alpha-mannosidase